MLKKDLYDLDFIANDTNVICRLLEKATNQGLDIEEEVDDIARWSLKCEELEEQLSGKLFAEAMKEWDGVASYYEVMHEAPPKLCHVTNFLEKALDPLGCTTLNRLEDIRSALRRPLCARETLTSADFSECSEDAQIKLLLVTDKCPQVQSIESVLSRLFLDTTLDNLPHSVLGHWLKTRSSSYGMDAWGKKWNLILIDIFMILHSLLCTFAKLKESTDSKCSRMGNTEDRGEV